MDASEAVRTKLDVREFSEKPVPNKVKLAVLEAGRLTQSGVNSQHWRFILVQEKEGVRRLAADSTTGGWVSGSDFAVIICTDPKKGYHLIDAGRAAQDMQLTAWDHGVASGLYTGFKIPEMRRDFGIPEVLVPTVVLGFGYPARKLFGKKSRKDLNEVAYLEKYGKSIDSLKP
jgi:nitroreductase